MRHLVEMS